MEKEVTTLEEFLHAITEQALEHGAAQCYDASETQGTLERLGFKSPDGVWWIELQTVRNAMLLETKKPSPTEQHLSRLFGKRVKQALLNGERQRSLH